MLHLGISELGWAKYESLSNLVDFSWPNPTNKLILVRVMILLIWQSEHQNIHLLNRWKKKGPQLLILCHQMHSILICVFEKNCYENKKTRFPLWWERQGWVVWRVVWPSNNKTIYRGWQMYFGWTQSSIKHPFGMKS